MKKSFLYNLFGLGKIPKRYSSIIKEEGIIVADEGISGSITFKKYKSPSRRCGFGRHWFIGSIVLTRKHILAFQFSTQIIGIPLDHERIHDLRCTIKNDSILVIGFDVSKFYDDSSGTIECKFSTAKAQSIFDKLVNPESS